MLQVLVLKGSVKGSNSQIESHSVSLSQGHEHAPGGVGGLAANVSAPITTNVGHKLAPGWPALHFNEEDESNPLWRYFQAHEEGLAVSFRFPCMLACMCECWGGLCRSPHDVLHVLHRSTSGSPTYPCITGALSPDSTS